jgi:hypothetical protein
MNSFSQYRADQLENILPNYRMLMADDADPSCSDILCHHASSIEAALTDPAKYCDGLHCDSISVEVGDSLHVEVALSVSISMEAMVQDLHPDELREELEPILWG